MLIFVWILYFVVWGLAIALTAKGKEITNKLIIIPISIISLISLVYLGFNDGITLILVLLATVFTATGSGLVLARYIHNNKN